VTNLGDKLKMAYRRIVIITSLPKPLELNGVIDLAPVKSQQIAPDI